MTADTANFADVPGDVIVEVLCWRGRGPKAIERESDWIAVGDIVREYVGGSWHVFFLGWAGPIARDVGEEAAGAFSKLLAVESDNVGARGLVRC